MTNEKSDLRKQAEERAALLPKTENLPKEEVEHLFHELKVHQIELEMQNEELRRTQAQLESARSHYFDLYDLAPVGYCTVSEKGLILEANLTFATMIEIPRTTLVNQPLSRFICKEDQELYYLNRKKIFESEEPRTFEVRLRVGEEKLLWTQLKSHVAQGDDGSKECRIAVSDLTERKQSEEDLRKSVERLTRSNEELEHFNKMMVDRELRMIELKKEVDKLCQESGQKSRYGFFIE